MVIRNKRVICPHCGGEILVPVETSNRQPVGSGTRRGQKLKRLNLNHLNVLNALILLGRPASVRSVQSQLWKDQVGRFTRDDFKAGRGFGIAKNPEFPMDLKTPIQIKPSGAWNYHTVQAILSVLVGHGDVSMTSAREKFDETQGVHDVQPVPHYEINPEAAERTRLAFAAITLQIVAINSGRSRVNLVDAADRLLNQEAGPQ